MNGDKCWNHIQSNQTVTACKLLGLNLTKMNDENVSKIITFMKWWSARGMVESLGLVSIYWLFWESISILRPKSSSTSLFEAFLLELASSSSTLKTASKLTPLTCKKKNANNNKKKKRGGGRGSTKHTVKSERQAVLEVAPAFVDRLKILQFTAVSS